MRNTKETKTSRERWESGRTYVVEQREKFKQKKSAPKYAETTTMAAPKCATEKTFRHSCRTKSNEVC